MRSLVKNWQPIVLLCLAVISRFFSLGSIPPANDEFIKWRIITAAMGTASILLFYLLVEKLSHKKELAWACALSLTLLPFHIEQSRIYSPYVWGLTILLSFFLIQIWIKQKIIKILVIFFAVIFTFRICPELQFWRFNPHIFPLTRLIERLFYLNSVNFLFFKNDSFWIGGLRDVGVMLPLALPVYVLGLIKLSQNMRQINWELILPLVLIWLLAAISPKFPEQRVIFFTTPYLAYVMGVGKVEIWSYLKTRHIALKITSIILLLLLSYNYLVFYHFYTWHYSQRIKNELSKQERNF